MAGAGAGFCCCACSAGAEEEEEPPPVSRLPIAWPMEEPTATPLQETLALCRGIKNKKVIGWLILTQLSTPSARTIPDRNSAEQEPVAAAAAAPAQAAGRPSSEERSAGQPVEPEPAEQR